MVRRTGSREIDSAAVAQWANWEISRRTLFKTSFAGLATAAVANGGLLPVTAIAAQEEEPILGGSISLSLADDDVQSFDPIIPTDNMSIWTMLLIYDQLIRVAPDGISLEPGLAESWTISDDLLTYTLTLRETTFHDGTTVVADDVVHSLDRAAHDELSTWASMVTAVSTITAPDPKTVVITLNSVYTPFEADLALFACSIIPKAAHEAQKEELFNKPIGSGPFIFDSWEKGTQIVLKKNPTYWDAGKPYLDEVVLKVLVDANARMLQFQGGEIDIATAVPYSQIESLKANPDVVVLQDSVARFDYIGFNVLREPWTDKNLRQAINYAVDKQQLIDNVLFGSAVAANTYLPLMAGHDDSIAGYPFDRQGQGIRRRLRRQGWLEGRIDHRFRQPGVGSGQPDHRVTNEGNRRRVDGNDTRVRCPPRTRACRLRLRLADRVLHHRHHRSGSADRIRRAERWWHQRHLHPVQE